VRYALLYLGVFAVLSVVGALAVYTEALIGLRWREWLTRHFFGTYLAERRYYRVERDADVDNPDQRIADDIRTYTSTTPVAGDSSSSTRRSAWPRSSACSGPLPPGWSSRPSATRRPARL